MLPCFTEVNEVSWLSESKVYSCLYKNGKLQLCASRDIVKVTIKLNYNLCIDLK